MLALRNPQEAYRRVDFDARIEGASPAQLVALCFEQAEAALASALFAHEAGNNHTKSQALTKALAAITALQFGAVDYIEWPAIASDIAATLADVDNNSARIGSMRLREARARSRVQKLTRREREVLSGVAAGLSNRLIGEKLSISPRTVEIHRANMLNKMGASHTSEAIRIAIEAALIS